MSSKTAITVENLHYHYQTSESENVLKGISLTIDAGEFVALVGQNGAGKTTLAKHFNGLLKASSGRVMVGNIDATHSKVSELAKLVGFVFQNPDHQIFHDSVEKEVIFGLKNLGLPTEEINNRVNEALNAVGLQDYRQAYPYDLSRGQRQRVALASVLAIKPEVIVLDEPTTGQDYRESMRIMEMINELNSKGHTIIFITHDMTLVAEFAKRVIALCQGEVLVDDCVRNVFTQPELLSKTLLELPPVVRLADELQDLGISENLLTVKEVYQALKILDRGENIGLCG
ncbi:MAG: ATP-binding cassette domain-containing protein [Firmicutes bacterium]|nr:ATP-binding cassette domain-containing protein [Bacillota bacterium]